VTYPITITTTRQQQQQHCKRKLFVLTNDGEGGWVALFFEREMKEGRGRGGERAEGRKKIAKPE
jgi:hypothetical protein